MDSERVGGAIINDAGTSSASLWTAAKLISVLGGKSDATAMTAALGLKLDANTVSALKAAQGKLIVSGLTIQWGTVDMASKLTSTVTFATPFASVPFAVNFSDECDDFTWLCKRKVEYNNCFSEQHSYATRYYSSENNLDCYWSLIED